MKRLRYIFVALLATISLAACTEDKEIDLYTPVSQIELLDTTLYINESVEMIPYFNPEIVTNPTIYWSVENATPAGCVTIDKKGILTAVSVGTATVKAIPTGEKFFATCNVTVKPTPTPLESFEFVEESLVLTVGKSESLSYTSAPAEALDFEVVWSLKDVTPAGAIEIDPASGLLISDVDGGSATVVATATDHDGAIFTDECSVTSKAILATSITIPATMEIEITKDSSISATVEPMEAVQSVEWVITDGSGSFTIDQVTGILSGVTAGEATIKAVATDGSGTESAECVVTIKEPALYESITLDETLVVSAAEKYKFAVKAMTPAYVTDPRVTWEIIEGGEFATIDPTTGLFNALSVGIAKVQATAVDASAVKSSICTVTITTEIPKNLVVDPGFESGALTNVTWKYWGTVASVENDEKINDVRSVRLGKPDAAGAIYQLITIPAKGAKYKYSVRCRIQDTFGPEGSYPNNKNSVLSLTLSMGGNVFAEETTTSASNVVIEGEFFVPENYSGDTIYIQAKKTKGIAYVDDFVFIKVLN